MLELEGIEFLARKALGEESADGWEAHGNRIEKFLDTVPETHLISLRRRLGLSALEMDAILITVGASLSPELSRLYAKLLRNPMRTGVTPELTARILSLSPREIAELLETLLGDTPLVSLGLFHAAEHDPAEPLLTTPLVCSRELIQYFLNGGTPDSVTSRHARVSRSNTRLADLPLESSTREALRQIETVIRDKSPQEPLNQVFHFSGPAGAGKSQSAAAICRAGDLRTVHVDMKALVEEGHALERALEEVCRLAYLYGMAPVFENWQALDDMVGLGERRHAFIRRAARLPTPLFITSSPRTDFEFENKARLVELEFEAATRRTRERIWSNYLNGLTISESLTPEHLAGAFNFTPGRIQTAFEYARNQENVLKGNVQISEETLLAGCRAMSNRNLSKLATRVEHRFQWKDLVLPDETMEQLRDIPDHIVHGRVVHDEWRLDLKSTGGRGLNALFSGPSGTGKTMAASIIAGDLKLEMYRVDLSSIISKYVGETEKNLGKIFAEAEGSNAILFFDEADSLFGKRGEVKDAHDRYANTEVNYLLQKMEDFRGITILATNLRENIDDAFLRRLHFIVEFPFPDIRERTRIWRGVFSSETPLDKNLDQEFLGRVLRIPGGNIMSIARNAAFLAAAEGRPVGMNQILRAAKREFEKEGRPFIPAELGKYRDYLSL